MGSLWSKDEDEIIKKYGTTMLSTELVKLIPNRSSGAIATRCKKLGIKKDGNTRVRLAKIGREAASNKLYKLDQTITFNDLDNETYQILVGSLLGDGSVTKNLKSNSKHYHFYEGHGKKQTAYVLWKSKLLSLFQPVYSDSCSPHFLTPSHHIFTMLRKEFYGIYSIDVESEKQIIPFDIVDKLDLFGLLIWYLDDGYLGRPQSGLKITGKIRKTYPHIIAKGYTYADVQKMSEFINHKFQLHSYVCRSRHKDGMNNLLCFNNDKNQLIPTWQQMVIYYKIPQCMYYKLSMHNGKKWETE